MKVTTRRKENKIKNDNITHRVCLVVDFIEKLGQIRLGSDDKEPRALALETEKVGHKCRMRLINNRMEGKQGTSMEVGRLCEMLCLLVFSLAFPSAARAYIVLWSDVLQKYGMKYSHLYVMMVVIWLVLCPLCRDIFTMCLDPS